MWDGHLDHMKTARYRVELIFNDKRLVHSAQYRAGSAARQLSAKQIQEILQEEEVIKPAKTKEDGPVVFPYKKNVSLRFFVDYRKLNVVTVKDSHLLSKMVGCIHSLGEARIFSKSDVNSGYWQIKIDTRNR